MTAKFEPAFLATVERERGFVNDAKDPGGATRYGITEAVARRHGYTGSMRRLPLGTAKEIYLKREWSRLRLGEMASQDVASKVFDAAVNCGITRVARWLQRGMNVLNKSGKRWPDIKADGKVGPRTIAVLNLALRSSAKAEGRIVETVAVLQGNRYVEICEKNPKMERFFPGWLDHRVGLHT